MHLFTEVSTSLCLLLLQYFASQTSSIQMFLCKTDDCANSEQHKDLLRVIGAHCRWQQEKCWGVGAQCFSANLPSVPGPARVNEGIKLTSTAAGCSPHPATSRNPPHYCLIWKKWQGKGGAHAHIHTQTHWAGNLLNADVQGHVKLLFGRFAAVRIPVHAGFHCSIIVRMLILMD